MTQPYYPNLDGKTNYDVAQGIRTAYDFIHQLTARLDKIERGNYVTRDQALTHLGPSSLRKQLQVTGSSPLNVTGLAGQLAQPQIADAQRVTALPPITDPLSQDGTLVSLSDQVYRFDGTTDPGTWKPITAGPAPGTAVTSLDTLTGPVTLVAGSNVTISDNVPLAGDITISASGTGGSGGGSGFPGIDGLDGEDAFAIPGAQGQQGNPGATGPQGPAGFGIDAQDPDEPMMIPGAQGPQGNPGATGATGPAGPVGFGIDGQDGEDGMSIPGPAGSGGGGGGLWNQILSATPTQTMTGLSNFLGTGAASSNGAVGQVISGTSGGLGAYTTSVPATPYTITALLTPNGASGPVTGLGWTDGTKIQFIYVNNGNNHTPIVQHNSNITTFAGTDFTGNGGVMSYFLAWLRIKDDGTNVTFSYSNDGITFTQAFTTTKASGYLGSTGYSHIFCGSPGGSGAASVTVLSWTQS